MSKSQEISFSDVLSANGSSYLSWTWSGVTATGWYGPVGATLEAETKSRTLTFDDKYGKVTSATLTYNYTFSTSRASFTEGTISLTELDTGNLLYEAKYTSAATKDVQLELDSSFIEKINKNKPLSINCNVFAKGKATKPSNPSSPPNQGSSREFLHSVNGKINSLTLTITYTSGTCRRYKDGKGWEICEVYRWNDSKKAWESCELYHFNNSGKAELCE